MKIILSLAACLSLSGCGQSLYEGYKLGRCDRDNAAQHTERDFGGIAWCVPGAAMARNSSSHLMD
jgi:hypothetical protein